MQFQQAKSSEFEKIKAFYWELIDLMSDQNDRIGWKKGIYPDNSFLTDSLADGELYTLTDRNELCACVILNSRCNEGYFGVPWSIDCGESDVLIPHALAVSPHHQGREIGTPHCTI